jgi:hypothetical protein
MKVPIEMLLTAVAAGILICSAREIQTRNFETLRMRPVGVFKFTRVAGRVTCSAL